jgi:hypothetical protein
LILLVLILLVLILLVLILLVLILLVLNLECLRHTHGAPDRSTDKIYSHLLLSFADIYTRVSSSFAVAYFDLQEKLGTSILRLLTEKKNLNKRQEELTNPEQFDT